MDEFRSYLNGIKGFPDFREDPPGTSVLVKRMRGGDEEARLSLIESTLKYIAALAKAHCHRWNAWRHRLDLVQEANAEVSERIIEYDPAKASLTDFVRYRSHVAFVDFWYRSKAVHRTEYGRKIANGLQKVHEELRASLGREPTLEELSERVGRDQSEVHDMITHPAVEVVAIGEARYDENDGRVVNLDSIVFQEFDPFRRIEAAELREVMIDCLGAEDADLLLAYLLLKSDGFRHLYRRLRGREITADAARKAKERLLKKLMSCPRVKARLPG